MTHFLVFESGKKDKRRSAPIEANDTKSIQHLQSRGWRVVSEYDEDVPTKNERLGIAAAQNARLTPPVLSVNPEAAFEADGNVLQEAAVPTETAVSFSFADVVSEEQFFALAAAGYDSEAALRDASDEQLRAVEGISPSVVRNIRKALQPKS